jgi:hypothetical protein
MLVNLIFFSASISQRMDKADRFLPLNTTDTARLVAAMGEDDYTYLILRDPVGAEVIKVTHTCGGLIVDRGEDGTEPLNFPRGSCVRWEMTPAVVKELICTHNCCEGECPCEPVAAAGITLPAGKVGVSWHGVAIFTGDTPMELAATGVPAWATITVGANYVTIDGVPTGSGAYNISVAATNCGGQVAVQQGPLIIGG